MQHLILGVTAVLLIVLPFDLIFEVLMGTLAIISLATLAIFVGSVALKARGS